jgi:hypothetical protein
MSVSRARAGSRLACVLLVMPALVSGCGGDDEPEEQARPVAGTFVGKARGTEAFVAVVGAPRGQGQQRRAITLYLCDGRRVCEWLTGSAEANDFSVRSDNEDSSAEGRLTSNSATGRVELPGDRTVRFEAPAAAAAAGLYNLTVGRDGRLRGASATGVGLTGRSTLPQPGNGTIRLADGTRYRFVAARSTTGDPIPFRDGEIRLIVLSEGGVRGAGKNRSGPNPDFFIRSAQG